jgi:hypothetical protein
MQERREKLLERFENIRNGLRDMVSRDCNFGRRDDVGSRLSGREQRGLGGRH